MALREPSPPVSDCQRYSEIPFPRYRYVPGLNPHPRNHPEGHSYGMPDQRVPPWKPEEWRTLLPYLYGIDLYNYAYWWECHETLEGLWHVVGKKSVQARFIQGIIQVAAANLHRHMGNEESAANQAEKGIGNLEGALEESSIYMGIDIPKFTRDVSDYFSHQASKPAMIRLFMNSPQ